MISKTFIRLFIFTLAVIATLVGSAFFGRDHLLKSVLDHKLGEISKQLGLDVHFEGVTLKGLNQVSVRGLRVGSKRWLTAQRVEIKIDPKSIWSLKPKLKAVYVIQPELYAEGPNLEEAMKNQRDLVKRLATRWQRRQKRRKNNRGSHKTLTHPHTQGEAFLKKLTQYVPYIELIQGQMKGAYGELWLHEAHIKIQKGALDGTWIGEHPQTGPCQVKGHSSKLMLYCSDHMRLPVGDSLEIAGRQIEWNNNPTPQLSLRGVHVRLKNRKYQLPFSEVKLNIVVGLDENSQGERPLAVEVQFPGGGAVQANGTTSKESGHLSAQLDNFPMSAFSKQTKGNLSATVQIWAKWKKGEVEMNGQVSGRNLMVENRAIAEAPIGPFNLTTRGLIGVRWDPKNYRNFKVSLQRSETILGHIQTDLDLSWDQLHKAPHIQGKFRLHKMKSQEFAQSIPYGLLPHLQPVQLKGSIGFDGEIDLNMSKLKDTVLKFKANLRRLKVLSHNDQINFDQLNKRFITYFEMPTGEVLTREVGPQTKRWVSLDEVPPLLPQAIIAQEDGGFYKHRGISLFHLRGSLIRNLESGRFVRGGSTLTMQLTRNLFLNRKKTLSRKLEELCLTWLLERRFTKNQIITLYINVVEFGSNLFGIKEAAEHYFQKEPKDLLPEEIVALTRMLPGPRLYESFFERKRFSKAYTNRVNRLLALLEKRGHLDPSDYEVITPTSLWELEASPQIDEDVNQAGSTKEIKNDFK